MDEQNPPRGSITQATAGHRGDKALAGLSIVGMAPAEEKVSLPGEPIRDRSMKAWVTLLSARRDHSEADGALTIIPRY